MSETVWLVIGFVGQGLFASRFIVQWLVSEREGKSVIPVVFWYLSLIGGLTLLSYALWREDPVIIVGQAAGAVIYSRNLVLIFRERRRRPRQPA
ncbi:MAG: lipid A biosynthesis protein [Alphaproteobacteria bacterium]|nr:lipid A biosynthesis protein [Alphaproteobacteria bacterium]